MENGSEMGGSGGGSEERQSGVSAWVWIALALWTLANVVWNVKLVGFAWSMRQCLRAVGWDG